mmetsp:Transcript_823/g.953  ORF Transcript_823/g.953 Transcript_823/m.953 type:complete len:103 (+) Transcript_823:1-309(+)
MEQGSRRRWLEKRKVQSMIQDIQDGLNVTSPDEWYRISSSQLNMFGGKLLSRYYPSCLQWLYPGYEWRFDKFRLQYKRTNQRALLLSINKLCSQKPQKQNES